MDLNSEVVVLPLDNEDSAFEVEQFDDSASFNTQSGEFESVSLDNPSPIRVEAEDLSLNSYIVENRSSSEISGNALISLKDMGPSGRADGIFTGTTGLYQVEVGYFDENDGRSSADVIVNGNNSSFEFDADLNGNRPSAETSTSRVTHGSIYLESGNKFAIEATANRQEFARIDYIEFKPVSDSEQPAPEIADGAIDEQSVPEIVEESADEPIQERSTAQNDPNYPVIQEFANAGVQGGIPNNQPIARTLFPGDDIQAAINDVGSSGGGVVLLSSGTYNVDSTIDFQDGVVLRGESRDSVILQSTIRSTNEKDTLVFDNDRYAGVENLTIEYQVPGLEPRQGNGLQDGGFRQDYYQNNPGGRNDLYVRQIAINQNSSNNWVNNVSILDSGTDPILVAGNNNTLSNNLIDGAYNKGEAGNGYYDVRGDYNLIQGETVRNIRHFAVQQGAAYNVIVDSTFEVDLNFHNGDDGNNLVESNTINIPSWHVWDIFDTGAARFGHDTPGQNNILVNNSTRDFGDGGSRYSEPNAIYTFNGYGAPVVTNWQLPAGGRFY